MVMAWNFGSSFLVRIFPGSTWFVRSFVVPNEVKAYLLQVGSPNAEPPQPTIMYIPAAISQSYTQLSHTGSLVIGGGSI